MAVFVYAFTLLSIVYISLGDAEVRLVQLPGRVYSATLQRNRIYVAAGSGGLQIVDVTLGRVVATAAFTGEEVTDVVVTDRWGLALTTTASVARLVEFAPLDGSVLRSIPLGTARVRSLVVVFDDLVALIGDLVLFVRPSTAEIVAEVRVDDGVLTGAHVTNGRLVIARRYPGGLVILDARRGTLAEVITTDDWLRQVRVVGHHAFVMGDAGLGRITLRGGTYELLDTTSGNLVTTPTGALFLTTSQSLRRLDSEGHEIGRMTVPSSIADLNGRVVAIGDTMVLMALNTGIAYFSKRNE